MRRDAVAYPVHMKDLYTRLRDAGFEAPFVRSWLLPDWWDDSLASVPANRALAEASISRMLGLAIRDLRRPERKLKLPPTSNVRLKRRKHSTPTEVAPSILLAERVAHAVSGAITGHPGFEGCMSAKRVRQSILRKRDFVDLEALLDLAWGHGIAVLHIREFPKSAKKIMGMALFCDGTPVIVLGSGSDSPPWLAFHLAHELGHIMLGHVTASQKPLVDGDIDAIDSDSQEIDADEFACEVLLGDPRPSATAKYGCTATMLTQIAKRVGAELNADPGAVALVYGRSAKRMPVAQNALKLLGFDRGARDLIAAALESRLPDDLPESTERFLSLVTVS